MEDLSEWYNKLMLKLNITIIIYINNNLLIIY